MSLYQSKEWQKAQKGQLYLAFVPELVAARARTNDACNRFNSTSDTSRRNMVNLWRKITQDSRPLPIIDLQKSAEEDERLFDDEPWIMAPIHADYGVNIQIGTGVFLNYNSTFVDTCPITIGARTLIGPNCSFYSGTHPVDPALRNGTAGPETGKPITIGEDSWIGGNVIVLPGVNIGKGCTIGAGSVVTRDIPPFHVAAGNPARVLRRIETAMDPTTTVDKVPGAKVEADGPEATIAKDALDAQKN